jgi:outer membrane protein assembly factor BamB
MASSKVIYLGVKGSIIAMDAASGARLWETHLKGSSFVNVVLDGENLYGATHGEIFCLDPKTGAGRWHDELRGMGYGIISIAAENAQNSLVTLLAEEQRREEAQRAQSSAGATAAN